MCLPLPQTCTLQVLRKSHAAGTWSWQTGDDRTLLRADAPAEHSTAQHAEHDHDHGHEHTDAGEHDCQCAPEPSQAEYEGAVAEATQNLQGAVDAINELLDEVKCELQELLEEGEES